MPKIEAKLAFYDPNTTQLDKEKFLDYVHVKDCGYWEYHRLQLIRHMPYYSLYLEPLDEYLPDEDVYEILRAFHITLENIEKKSFGYQIEFSVGLLALGLRNEGIEFYSPLEAKTWVSVQKDHLKAHQLEQLETLVVLTICC